MIDLKPGQQADEQCCDVVAEAEAALVDALFDEIVRDLIEPGTAALSRPIHPAYPVPRGPRGRTGEPLALPRHIRRSSRSPPSGPLRPSWRPNPFFVGGINDRHRTSAKQRAGPDRPSATTAIRVPPRPPAGPRHRRSDPPGTAPRVSPPGAVGPHRRGAAPHLQFGGDHMRNLAG